jgi:FKBP-type peptidyl-prolyl cis-trans isomerase
MDINMKKVILMTALLCSAVLSFGQEQKAEKNDTLSYLLGVNLGEMINQHDFPVDAIDMDALKQGVIDAVAKNELRYDPYIINELFNRIISENKALKASVNLENGRKFLEEVATQDGVVVTESGLHYQIVKPGQGALVRPSDLILLNYKGMLTNGEVFDENEGIEFGADQVIPGMTEGLTKIAKGGKIRLFIPPHLAYGERGAGPIAPNSVIIFEVEVVDILAE